MMLWRERNYIRLAPFFWEYYWWGALVDTYGERKISCRRLNSLYYLEVYAAVAVQNMNDPWPGGESLIEHFIETIGEGIQLLTPSWVTTILEITGILLLAWVCYRIGLSSK
ncbi:MAG: hypothetical protein HXS44_12085 [Theionarchaea archaeon]|nr:hypothetical protein [Theionarchaea archaeon]